MLTSVRRFLVVAAAALVLAGVLATAGYAGPIVRVNPGASAYTYSSSVYSGRYSYYPSYSSGYNYGRSYTPYVNYDPFYAVPARYSYPPSYSGAYYVTPPLPYRPYSYGYYAYPTPTSSYGVRYYFP